MEETQNPRPRGQTTVRISAGFCAIQPGGAGSIAVPDTPGGLPQPEPARTTRPAQRGNKFASKGKFWPGLAASLNIRKATLPFGSLMPGRPEADRGTPRSNHAREAGLPYIPRLRSLHPLVVRLCVVLVCVRACAARALAIACYRRTVP